MGSKARLSSHQILFRFLIADPAQQEGNWNGNCLGIYVDFAIQVAGNLVWKTSR
jgi:hypothetical protein